MMDELAKSVLAITSGPELELSTEENYEELARTQLLKCAAKVFHCPIAQVTEAQLIEPWVEYMFYLEVPVSNKNMYAAARRICAAIDGGNTTYFYGKYSKVIHPLIKGFLTHYPDNKKYNAKAACMELLEFLCDLPIFRLQRPFDFRVSLIERVHLVRYRSALLTRVQRGEVAPATERKQLGIVIRWLKELQSEGRVSQDLDFTGLTIPKSEHRQRRRIDLWLLETVTHSRITFGKADGKILFVILLLATGARPNEISKLTPRHLDYANQTIWLQSKNGYGRWVPLLPATWQLLERYLTTYPVPNDDAPIIRNRRGSNLRVETLNQALRKTLSQCHIDGGVAFRHTFATGCLETGVSAHVTTYLLGHKDPTSLETYQRVDDEFLQREVERAYEDWEV